jgi:hypothetical protein
MWTYLSLGLMLRDCIKFVLPKTEFLGTQNSKVTLSIVAFRSFSIAIC